jgi:hypothetical protein
MFTLNRTSINYYMKMILKVLLYSVLHLNIVPFVILLYMCHAAFFVGSIQFYSSCVYIN